MSLFFMLPTRTASLGVVTFTSDPYSFTATDFSPSTCGIIFNNDGTVDSLKNGSALQIGTWHPDAPQAGLGDDYEVTSLSAGASGTWTAAAAADDSAIALTSDRTWSRTRVGGAGTDTVVRDFKVNATADAGNTDTANVTCIAETI